MGDGISPLDSFYVGCLRGIYHGFVNVLEELKSPEKHTASLRAKSGSSHSTPVKDVVSTECRELNPKDLSITLLSAESAAVIPQERSQYINIQLGFRLPVQNEDLPVQETNLISGDLNTQFGAGNFKVTEFKPC